MDLSIVIPVRNEESTLPELTSRLYAAVKEITNSYEIIFVTDENTDRTYDILLEISRINPKVKVIKLSRSRGQYIALYAGVENSCGDVVVTMDGDLQDSPEDIVKLYIQVKKGFAVACGVKEKKHASKIRGFFSKAFQKVWNFLSYEKIKLNTSIFRAMSKETVKEIIKYKEYDFSLSGVLALIGFSTIEVPVLSGRRKFGDTKYSYFDQINLALSFILSFSVKPIRILLFFGLSLTFMFFILLLYSLFYLNVTFIFMSFLLFLVSLILSGVGFIGEYIFKIYMQVKNRPLYTIEKLS
jgi:dolichol-phosphate mannosyltransferase